RQRSRHQCAGIHQRRGWKARRVRLPRVVDDIARLHHLSGAGQMVQASYIVNHTRQANASGLPAAALVDASTLVTRTLPNDLFAASYNGVLAGRYFATAQFSRKTQGFRNNGGTSAAIADSPFRTLGATAGVPGSLFYHAPYLDATDPENRDNHQVAASV